MVENQLGVKIRAMLETVHRDGEKQKDTGHQQMPTNPEATKTSKNFKTTKVQCKVLQFT